MNKRYLLVLDPFNEKNLSLIESHAGSDFTVEVINPNSNREEYIDALSRAEIIIGEPDINLLSDLDSNCPNLRFIQMTWAGTDIYTNNKVLFPQDKVMLSNASGAYGNVMSQFVIGQIMFLLFHFGKYYSQMERKSWMRQGPILSLDKAKVMIFGAGDIGSSVAKRLMGFDTYNIGVCRDIDRIRPGFNELCTLDMAESYLSEADVVICCMPNSKETEGYFNEDRLSRLKRNSIIVNVGRGNFIDCIALDKLLRMNHLWGAALDVTNPEPLPSDHPLWDNDRCFITPHASGVTFGHLDITEDKVCDIVCTNIDNYCGNKPLINRIY